MDQEKVGSFLKELRKEKGITQEKMAEMLNVNSRTISRWENARTLPDFDVLIELAKFYDVSVDELLNGERRDMMDKQTEETLRNISDYTNTEKERMLKNQHFFAWTGVIAWIVFLVMEALGLADEGITEEIASFAAGIAFGMSVMMVLMTSRQFYRFRRFKRRLLHMDDERPAA